jgi:hypothetical protein
VTLVSLTVAQSGACTSDWVSPLNPGDMSYRVPRCQIDATIAATSHFLAFHIDVKTKHISTSAFKHALFHFIFAVKPGAMAGANENPVVFFDIALGGELC